MKRNIYKLLSSAKQGLFALALTVFSGTVYSQTTYTFNYTGSTQTISLPAGNYSIECWGADGGNATNGTVPMSGGKGGYSKGVYTNASTATLNIYVGGHGGNASGQSNLGGGGGGMSDVTTATNTNIVIIAAGGGGGATSGSASEASTGGEGGGLTGGTAIDGTGVSTGAAATGGSQTAGGSATAGSYGAGSPGGYGYGGGGSNGATPPASPSGTMHGAGGVGGAGGNGGWNGGGAACTVFTGNEHSGGGGGGYFGGGGGRGDGGAGGGGSGFIGGVTSGTTVTFAQTGYVTNPDITGNGRVLITALCNISLSVTGVNASGAMCSGNSVTITTNAVSNYAWSNGSTTSSIVVSPTATTVYTLSATSISLCSSSASETVIVSPGSPTLNVVNSTSGTSNGVCANATATLTASGALTYTWTGGITNGASFTPAVASTYTVTGANGCGTGTAVASVSIHPNPTLLPISVVNPTMCSGSTTTLTASGTGISTYSWSTSSTASFITVSPGSTTTYTVKATSALGCTTTATKEVTVVATPLQIPVASPSTICLGNSSTLSAVATSFTWMPGGANAPLIVVIPVTSGVFVYTVTKANGACSDTKTVSLTVNALPVITTQASPTAVCASIQTATLSAIGGISYTWAPTGGNASTAMVTATANTIYTLTASNGICASTNTIQLIAIPLPTIVASASPQSICAGAVITLSASGGTSYLWSPVNSTNPSLTVNPTLSTQYSVIGTNSAGCVSGTAVTVTVYPVPILNANTNNPAVCLGNPAVITAGGADTYSWSTNSTATSITVTPTQSTIYSVTGTNMLGNCSSTQTVMVNVITPGVTISGNNVICQGETATLTANASGNIVNYSWSTGLPVQTILVSPASTAIYVATAIVTTLNIACTGIGSVTVTVNPVPNIVVIPSKLNMCTRETVALSATGGTAYAWSWGSQSSNSPTIAITPTVITNLIVNVIGTGANGCINTGSVAVLVSACTGIDEANLSDNTIQVYPNPSQGEINITFGSALEMLLINETGQLIRKLILNDENGYKASVSGLSDGVYFLTGQSGDKRINKKIIISR